MPGEHQFNDTRFFCVTKHVSTSTDTPVTEIREKTLLYITTFYGHITYSTQA